MIEAPPLGLGRARGGVSWLAAFVALFAVMAAWSLASPLFSGPDEPAQVLRAASLVRGELLGRPTGGKGSPDTVVVVPAWLAGATRVPACFEGQPAVPASCSPGLPAAAGTTSAVTYTGRYPPLYYALVGWPTLLVGGPLAVYLMRLCGAAACAALLAGALWCALRSRHRAGLVVGLSLCVTPQALFLGAVVNPSALEISAAICLWTAGVVVAEQAGRVADRAVLAWLVLAGAVMANMTGLSPFLLALSGLVVIALVGRSGLVALLRARAGRVGLGVLLAAGLVAVAWILDAGGLRVLPSHQAIHTSNPWMVLAVTAVNIISMAPQYVGAFGGGGTYLPVPVYVVALGAGLGMIGLGFVKAGRRLRTVIVALALACLVVPTLVSFSQAVRLGVFGQARYWMPLWVGLPLLVACAAIGEDGARLGRRGPRLVAAIGVGALGLQVLGWLWALRRYGVGLGDGILRQFPSWHPPLPVIALLGALLAGLGWLGWSCWPRRGRGAGAGELVG